MRYINNQQHATSCGPVAIINTLKWLGYRCSYREYVNHFNWDKSGMCYKDLSKSMREFGVSFKKINNPSMRDIEKSLNKGNAIILGYRWFKDRDNGGHFVFIERHTPTRLMIVNPCRNGTIKRGISKRKMKAFFKISKKVGFKRYPTMWEIYK